MAQNNAINNKSSILTIDPGSSGDSFIQHAINSTDEFRIGCDDTDDSFKISQGSALGTNDTYSMSDVGEQRMPLNPAFSGILGSNDLNVTGNGTTATLGVGTALTEIFDQGGDFTTAGTFTAPVSGIYLLVFHMDIRSQLTGGTTSVINIVTSNRTYSLYYLPTSNAIASLYGGNNTLARDGVVLADMDAADTATVNVVQSGGALAVDDIFANSSFFGVLVG